MGGRQNATLDNGTAGLIKIVIGGDRAQWVGTGDGNWDTTTHAAKNFKLSTAGTATDFLANDSVLFDDTATGTTVNITGNVAPANTTFNDSTKNYTLQSSGAFGITAGTLIKNGTGSLTISNANTYSGGTILNAGTLNINNAAAIGSSTSALTLNGGTLDNTSGAAITLANNNPSNLNGNITFTGTSDLGLGTGRVTLVGTSSINVAGATATLSMGPIIGTGGLTKSGPGTLTLTPTAGNAAANLTEISGDLNVTGGTFNNGLNDTFFGGLTGNGTVANGSTTSRWMTVGLDNNNTTFSGALVDGAGATTAGGNLGLRKRGSGTLTLSGASTLSDQLNFESGTILLTGSIIPGNHLTNGSFVIIGGNNTPGITNGVLDIEGGTLQAIKDNAPSVQVGAAYGTAGALRIGPGSTLNSRSELWLAQGDGGYGDMDMTGGTATIGSWFAVGRGGGQGVVNLSGGTINVTTNQVTIGSLPSSVIDGLVHGMVNVSGGTLNATNNVWVGEQSSGVLNMLPGNGQVIAGQSVVLASNGTAGLNNLGIVNLMGGTITTNSVTKGGGTGIFNFNGGTLQAANDNALFITGLTHAYTYGGGANIDTNGHTVSFDQVLEDPTGNGVSAAGLTVSGGGYIGTPFVQITGGGGTGATAIANINAAGNLTGITITNPGIGYTSAPTFSLVGGGIGNNGAIGGTATLAPNVSGGLNKVGAGSLTVLSPQTYTGPTRVTQGTLALGLSNAFSSSSTLQMAGGTLATNGQTNQFGALQVLDNSVIDLGSGNSILNFGNSSAIPWNTTKTVSILNWTGTLNTAGGADQLIFAGAGLTAAQRSEIHFPGFNGAVFVGNELVPSSVTTRKLGDFNVDGHVNAADVTAALSALTDFNAYKTSKGLTNDDFLNIGDVDASGFVSNADLQSLINLLAAGGGSGSSTPAVPEPDTIVLLVMGAIPGLLLARKLRGGGNAA